MVGWLSTNIGTLQTFIPMVVIAVIALSLALSLWPKSDECLLVHSHDDLPADHEHLVQHQINGRITVQIIYNLQLANILTPYAFIYFHSSNCQQCQPSLASFSVFVLDV